MRIRVATGPRSMTAMTRRVPPQWHLPPLAGDAEEQFVGEEAAQKRLPVEPTTALDHDTRKRRGRDDAWPPARVGGENTVVADQVLSRVRDESGEALQQRERGEPDGRRAVAAPGLQVVDERVSRPFREAAVRDGAPEAVPEEALERGAILGVEGGAGVEIKTVERSVKKRAAAPAKRWTSALRP